MFEMKKTIFLIGIVFLFLFFGSKVLAAECVDYPTRSFNNCTVPITYVDQGGSGLDECRYKVVTKDTSPGTNYATWPSAGSCSGADRATLTVTITVGSKGAYDLYWYAKDNAGNEDSGKYKTMNIIEDCLISGSTCSSPEGSISCGGTKSGCLNANDWKYYSVPGSAGKEVTVTLTYSGTGCNVNDLYIYKSNCTSIYISSGNLWTETWTGTPATDIRIGIDGDSSNPNCQWTLSVGCVLPLHTLSVTKTGTGSGTVTSSPAGINCGADCSESYGSGTSVTLTASPVTGSTFAGWSGACSGTGSCILTMDADKSVTATFTVACISHYSYSCYSNDVYWYDSCGNREEKKQECGTGYWRCCNNNCGRQYVYRGCSGTSCYSYSGSCRDCGVYTCSGRSCTTICSQACGAECDEDSDCLSGSICRSDCTCESADTTHPTTNTKVIRTSTGEDVTAAGIWLNADTYTIQFEDADEMGGSGLKSCEYHIYSCDAGGTNCNTSVVSLTSRSCNWSFDITAGVSLYNLEGLGRYRIYSGSTDNANNSGVDYKYLNFDFTPPVIEIK